MTLTVTVLGSSGMFATTERACAGYLVEIEDRYLLVDCGAGVWRNLVRRIPYERLDGVLLTHRHPDHTSDIFQMVHARRYGGPEPLPAIPLWAPAETLARIDAYTTEVDLTFDFRTVAAGDTTDVLGASVTFVNMAHPPETLGCRIEAGGVVLAYTADSGPAADFATLAADADVLVAEATLQDSDEEWEGHLTARQASTIANEVGARDLVLTHLPPGRDLAVTLDEARSTRLHGADVRLAQDGMRVEL